MVVYDVTRPATFAHVKQWLTDIENSCPDIVKILGGMGD